MTKIKNSQVSRVIAAVPPAVQSVDTECSFQVAINCRQIKYPVQQQLAYNNLYEFPLSSQSHLARPAPRTIQDHKAHHYRQKNNVFFKKSTVIIISAATPKISRCT